LFIKRLVISFKRLTNYWIIACTCVLCFLPTQLSQILGHSDQLYTKLPRGLRVWQYSNAIAVTGLAAAVSNEFICECAWIVTRELRRFGGCVSTVPSKHQLDSDYLGPRTLKIGEKSVNFNEIYNGYERTEWLWFKGFKRPEDVIILLCELDIDKIS